MAVPQAVQTLADSWSSFYGNRQLLSVTMRFLHIASTVVGGGAAITLDGFVIRAIRKGHEVRASLLSELRGTHIIVVPALVVVTVTGVLMAGADLDTFLNSTLFWVKLAVFALLVANGAVLVSVERSVARSGGLRWNRIVGSAIASIVLWLATVFVGTWLTVAA